MRTTITINDNIFRALKVRAAETDKTVSSIVEDAVKFQLLEDLEDVQTAKERDKEPTYSFESLVAKLKADGLL